MGRLATVAALIGATALVGAGYAAGWNARAGVARTEKLAAAEADKRLLEASVQVSQTIGGAVEQKAVEIRWRTRTLLKEVPVYVTAEADARCTVPRGFVQLHDAAATGVAPGPTESPDAPSGVTLSAVSGTVVENYGICHELRNTVLGWQSWYAQQSALRP